MSLNMNQAPSTRANCSGRSQTQGCMSCICAPVRSNRAAAPCWSAVTLPGAPAQPQSRVGCEARSLWAEYHLTRDRHGSTDGACVGLIYRCHPRPWPAADLQVRLLVRSQLQHHVLSRQVQGPCGVWRQLHAPPRCVLDAHDRSRWRWRCHAGVRLAVTVATIARLHTACN